jgi:MFS family permease
MHARTLTVFRLYQLFNGIIFTGPVWAVYLLSRGLTLTQFGLVEAALHVGMLVAQVPTGALADALGRRRLLVAAGFFTAVGELGYVYAPGFGLICWPAPSTAWHSPCAPVPTRPTCSTRSRMTMPRRSSLACWAGCGPCSSSRVRSRSWPAA